MFAFGTLLAFEVVVAELATPVPPGEGVVSLYAVLVAPPSTDTAATTLGSDAPDTGPTGIARFGFEALKLPSEVAPL